MSRSDNTDSDDHDSHNEDQLWNEESLKNYILNILCLLKFSYFTSLEISSALLINIIYQISAEYDKDSHNSMFESWKTAFIIRRLTQSEKLQAL